MIPGYGKIVWMRMIINTDRQKSANFSINSVADLCGALPAGSVFGTGRPERTSEIRYDHGHRLD